MVGKTSKKGWRNIKLADEITTMTSNDFQKELGDRVGSLFTEDVTGGSKGISKRILEEIKLKGKSAKPSISMSEVQLLKKAIKKAESGVRAKQPVRTSRLCDVWSDAPVQKLKTLLPGTIVRRESFAPGVVPAVSSLSVNPAKEDFEAMIVAEAEKEVKRNASKRVSTNSSVPAATGSVEEVAPELPTESKVTERKTKAQKLKEKRHQQMLKEHEIRRKEKQERRALQDKSARKALEEEQARRREMRMLTDAKRVVAEAAGKFTLSRGAGGRLVDSREPIPLEVAESLRRIVPLGDPVLERRASLLKRRMIEQVPEMNAEYKEKLRFAKLDAAKARKLIDKDAKFRCVLLS